MKTIHSKEYKDILLKLKLARKKAGLTQKDIAKLLKKPQSFVSKIENGERRLDIVEVKHLAKIYRIDARNLL